MARPRKKMGADADSRIVALIARGATAETIAHTLGVSKTTAFRRMQELRGDAAAIRVEKRKTVPSPAAAPGPKPLPDTIEAIQEETPLEQINAWLKMTQEEVDAARSAGESETTAKMIRLASALLTLKNKATPITPPNPDDNPDFKAMAAKVRKRWHDLLDKVK